MLSLKRFVDKVLRPEFPRIGLYIGGIPSDAENVFPFVVLRLSDGDGEGTVDGGTNAKTRSCCISASWKWMIPKKPC